MEITEVRIKLMEDNSGSNERLQAFCSITFDDMFVIRDLKIIEGAKGFFVAMPSRKLTDRCGHCGTKNHLRSRFCSQCGCRLDENRAIRDADGRAKLHADIAPPDQLDVPGEDPGRRARVVRRRARALQAPGLRLALRRPRRRRVRHGGRDVGGIGLGPRRAARCAAARSAATPSTTATAARSSAARTSRPGGNRPRGHRLRAAPGRGGVRQRALIPEQSQRPRCDPLPCFGGGSLHCRAGAGRPSSFPGGRGSVRARA